MVAAVGRRQIIAAEQFVAGHTRDEPTLCAQIVHGVASRSRVDQVGHVDIQAAFAHVRCHLTGLPIIEIDDARGVFGRHRAARGAQVGDRVEQPILGVRREIDQQPLCQPCGRDRWIETGRRQRGWPVVAQVDADGPVSRRRLRAKAREYAGLEVDDRGLVDLVHHCACWPRQPVGAGVQARGQDHRLRYATVFARGNEVIVKEPGTHGHSGDHGCHSIRCDVVELRTVEGAVDHRHEEVDTDRAYKRCGELVVDQVTGVFGGHRSACGHHGCRNPDTRCEIPAVAITACHGRPQTSVAAMYWKPANFAVISSSGCAKPLAANRSCTTLPCTSQPSPSR